MSGKLKIYACSGIGETDQSGFNYWTDNTNVLSNTQAVNTLLALINRNYIEVNYLRSMSVEDKIANLNDIDVYTVCLTAAEKCADDPDKLKRAGDVIALMIHNGDFNFDSLDNSTRDAHLDDLIEKFGEMMQDDGLQLLDFNTNFIIWYQQNIIARNKVGLSKEEQNRMQQALESTKPVGDVDEKWMEDNRISEYLLKAGTYFLYTYLTADQLGKLPAVFKVKKQKQIRTYNYCKQVFVDVYGSEAEMQDIIYSGIVKEFGDTPQNICDGFTRGEQPKQVGFIFMGLVGAEAVKALIEILTVVGTLLASVITAICTCIAQTNVAKYGALDRQIVNSSVPNPEDFEEIESGRSSTKNSMSWLPLAAIGAGLLLLLRKSN